MTREIKFRAWNETHGLVYNPGFQTNGGQVGLDDMCAIVPNLMQFTGLLDKNGKEIYEGDVLSYRGNGYEVRYDAKVGAFRVYQSDGFHLSMYQIPTKEIIGNIYENPELLNDKGV